MANDVWRAVRAFFCGYELSRSVTHTNLVLITKKEVLKSFSDLRPISLSCFLNKMISRVLNGRILMVLPKIISPNQLGFVKGRSIVENVLLAQEIIKDINRRNRLVNVVVKLDMTKAYDKVSWVYLTKVMRKFWFLGGFDRHGWRLVSNNWCSVLVNGQFFGFFQSSRGLK